MLNTINPKASKPLCEYHRQIMSKNADHPHFSRSNQEHALRRFKRFYCSSEKFNEKINRPGERLIGGCRCRHFNAFSKALTRLATIRRTGTKGKSAVADD